MRTFAAVALAALLPAQQQPPQAPPVLVDYVVATVNDAAITWSQLVLPATSAIRSRQLQLQRALTTAEKLEIYARELRKRIDTYAMAQAAKTLGIVSPERIEEIVRDELERDEDEQVRDAGTQQEYMRQLQRQGRTWQTYWREQRIEKMADLADEIAVRLRMQQQSNLFLTPRMLRDAYRQHLALFEHGAAANLSLIVFTGEGALEHARQAAQAWRDTNLSAEAVIARVPGARATPTVVRNVGGESSALASEELVAFAKAGPEGNVSAPTPIGTGVAVARIVEYVPERHGKFEDADVQLQLRDIAEVAVRAEFKQQALQRALDRTQVWQRDLLR